MQLIGGILGSRSAEKQAKRQMAMQAKMHEDQIALQREGLDWQKSQYADWKSRENPMWDRMMDNLYSGIEPDWAGIAGDNKAAFESARGANRRDMMRYGIRPQDGQFMQADRMSRNQEAASHVGTRNRARQNAAGAMFNRTSNIWGGLQGMGGALSSGIANGYNNVAGAMGNMAGMYGQHAADRYNMTMNKWDAIGSGVGAIFGAWNQHKGGGKGTGG
jgi:hypothetical protein